MTVRLGDGRSYIAHHCQRGRVVSRSLRRFTATVLDQNTELALTKLSAASVLAPGDAEILVPAARLYHTLTQVLRLCLDKSFVAADAPRALKDLLARASEMPDFPTLEAMLKDTLAAVHAAFERIVA